MSTSRVVVATLDTVAERMAGPAIRAWEACRLLAAAGHQVRLVTFGECSRTGDGFSVEQVTVDTFRAVVDEADVLVVQGFLGAAFDWLYDVDVVLVVDLYDPFHIEILEVGRDEPREQRQWSLDHARHELAFQLARGDYFLCASQRQRDLWIGHLAAVGRVNLDTFDASSDLSALVAVAPFGIAADPPQRQAPALRGVVDGIGADDRVVLWAGGVYNWFDPLTLVRATALLAAEHPDLRLVFMGMSHPNPDVPRMRVAAQTQELADELGLTGSSVFFQHGWVPYERRADFLLDADVGVSCHLPGIETRYSFRTRMLDYLWAGLPIVCTDGDVFADLVRDQDLGEAVPPHDPQALAEALARVLDGPPDRRDRVRAAGVDLVWDRALAPLVSFCAAPARAADAGRLVRPTTQAPARGVRGTARAALGVLRRQGLGGLWRKVRARLSRG